MPKNDCVKDAVCNLLMPTKGAYTSWPEEMLMKTALSTRNPGCAWSLEVHVKSFWIFNFQAIWSFSNIRIVCHCETASRNVQRSSPSFDAGMGRMAKLIVHHMDGKSAADRVGCRRVSSLKRPMSGTFLRACNPQVLRIARDLAIRCGTYQYNWSRG